MKSTTVDQKLILIRQRIADQFKNNWDLAKKEVQNVIDLYNATGLPVLDSADLQALFNDNENLLYNKLTGNKQAHLTIGTGEGRGHLAIDRSKAMEMITKPTGYNELLTGIENCAKNCIVGFDPSMPWVVRFPKSDIKDYFVISSEGVLQFTDKCNNDIDGAGKVFINTDKGHAVYLFIEKVTAAFIECGIAKFMFSAHQTSVPGEKVAAILTEGLQSIYMENGTFIPVLNQANTMKATFPFDNNNQRFL